MKLALVTLSKKGLDLAEAVADALGDASVYVHDDVPGAENYHSFDRVIALTPKLFEAYDNVVYFMPTGVVSRAIAPCIKHKTTDPAVVVVDVAGRWAISLLSGHEGGANDLAMAVANVLDAEPIVTTTTEAEKTIVAGIGCRRGTTEDEIVDALKQALAAVGRSLDDVRLLATADVKKDEFGLLEAANRLQIPLRVIASDTIRNSPLEFSESLAQEKLNLPGVAEPAALLAGRRTSLLLPKTAYKTVTIALARERSLWSE